MIDSHAEVIVQDEDFASCDQFFVDEDIDGVTGEFIEFDDGSFGEFEDVFDKHFRSSEFNFDVEFNVFEKID